MKKYILLVIVLLPLWLAAQEQQFSYQAVLRNTNGAPLANTSVVLVTSILQASPTGTPVFQESHSVTTDSRGLASIYVGSISDLSNVDWSNGPYFLNTSIDGESLGTTQLVSVPYAIYSDEAATARSFDYENLTGAPDISEWDLNVNDDFDGDYESLLNKPETITAGQQSTLNNITVTSATNLDVISADVIENNQKVSFPGFGTVPGTALEAGTDIWTQEGENVFFNTGKVGINVPTSADFGDASLYVGGGVKYGVFDFSTLPPQDEGLFFYLENVGPVFYDAEGLKVLSGAAWVENNGDLFSGSDVLIQSSLGIGQDIVNGEDFGFATIKLKENNTRILFEDTDPEGGPAPSNDWQLTANSSANGGGEYFAIEDVTAGTTPFLVSAGAPDNSLYVAPSGNIGIGTSAPGAKLDVNGTIKAGSFIGDGSGLTGITGGTGGISNPGSTTISAGTGQIDLQVNNTAAVVIANNGNVGIGTTSPSSALEVNGDLRVNGGLRVTGNIDVAGAISYNIREESEPTTVSKEFDVSAANILTVTTAAGEVVSVIGLLNGVPGQVVTLINNGTGTLRLSHNGAGTAPFLLIGGVDADLAANQSATLAFDGSNWFALSIAN